MTVYDRLQGALFEAFLAGYKAGFTQTNDVVSAFEEWWKEHVEDA